MSGRFTHKLDEGRADFDTEAAQHLLQTASEQQVAAVKRAVLSGEEVKGIATKTGAASRCIREIIAEQETDRETSWGSWSSVEKQAIVYTPLCYALFWSLLVTSLGSEGRSLSPQLAWVLLVVPSPLLSGFFGFRLRDVSLGATVALFLFGAMILGVIVGTFTGGGEFFRQVFGPMEQLFGTLFTSVLVGAVGGSLGKWCLTSHPVLFSSRGGVER